MMIDMSLHERPLESGVQLMAPDEVARTGLYSRAAAAAALKGKAEFRKAVSYGYCHTHTENDKKS